MPGVAGVSGSSLIGVAIACSGNVLISLALTIQKLAHRRISEAHHGRADDEADEDEDIERGAGDIAGAGDESRGLLKASSGRSAAYPNGKASGASSRNSTPTALDSPAESSDDESPERREGVQEGAYLKSKLWWIGLAMISIGEGGNFLSYAFAPASVVAPLGTVALVANCIFAPIILKERFRPRELIGMGLAILGAVTVVYASSDTNPRLDPSELVIAITQPPFLIYTGINLLLLLMLMYLSRSAAWGGRFAAVDVGICAIFGGYTVLSTKAMASLLSTMFLQAFEYPVTWGLVVVLVGTSLAQVKYLNKALMTFQSKEVIPTQFVFFSLAAIIGSGVLYQEFRDIPLTRMINFIFGIGITFTGVHLLTSMHSPATPSPSPPPSSTSSPQTTPTPLPRTERTPLLIAPSPHSDAYHHALSPSIRGRGVRLLKRNSTGEIHTLGINSQAGFLLLGSTPPATAIASRRDRSSHRAERGEAGSLLGRSPGVVHMNTRRVSDVAEAAAVGRRVSSS
ncbi:magnesium transporter NIPA-domain-containing protein [Dioszegia hungarica]|uniref:Magnesium transporter NIPA-domain-containing protein n=1 Tax=Dioszegia hungarica TaxID=4972 RepID=A0AA38HHT0_9TREE|nr:magnesium transporter NIPA-domain-containing protein [Dioszegia hungarica]KAI9639504.1 magnesium transporter NIPA-domain-containing protein [Dioszegia hungarica]